MARYASMCTWHEYIVPMPASSTHQRSNSLSLLALALVADDLLLQPLLVLSHAATNLRSWGYGVKSGLVWWV